MYTERIKVTAKGQVTLPKNLREKLKIREGNYLEVFIRKNELVLRPLPDKPERELLLEYCKKNAARRVGIDDARRILSRVPFSLSKRVHQLREER